MIIMPITINKQAKMRQIWFPYAIFIQKYILVYAINKNLQLRIVKIQCRTAKILSGYDGDWWLAMLVLLVGNDGG